MFKYWQKDPPTHLLVQGLLKSFGVMKDQDKQASDAPTELSDESFQELAENFNFSG